MSGSESENSGLLGSREEMSWVLMGIVACVSIREGCIPPVLDEGPGFSISDSCDGRAAQAGLVPSFAGKLVCLFIAFDPTVG